MAAPVGFRTPLLLALALTLAGAARAELVDPTRSPIGARGNGEATTGDAKATVAPAPAPSRVQMIVRGPGETLTAVVDGNKVRVGDTVRLPGGSARVERITETSVVLARAGGRETLQLIPGIERFVQCARRTESQRPGGC